MDFSDFNLGFTDFMGFRSDFKVFTPDSRDFTSDYKDFRDFTRDFRDFRSDFRTISLHLVEIRCGIAGALCIIEVVAFSGKVKRRPCAKSRVT